MNRAENRSMQASADLLTANRLGVYQLELIHLQLSDVIVFLSETKLASQPP